MPDMSAEVVVAMVIAWTIGQVRNNRELQRISRLSGAALDEAVGRTYETAMAGVGTDPAIERLLTEARATEGQVSPGTRSDAERAVASAMRDDPRFNAQVQQSVSAQGAPAAGGHTITHAGVVTIGHGNKTWNKVVHKAGENPLGVLLGVTALILLALGAYLLTGGKLPGGDSSTAVSSQTISGTWTPSDGTDNKIFTASGGQCTGFYYSNGRPLDTGGPMTCAIKGTPDTNGRYELHVTQTGNSGRYLIEFTDPDHGTVFTAGGTKLYDIERF